MDKQTVKNDPNVGNINLMVLKAINNGNVKYISKDDGMPLLSAGLITVDTNQLDDRGNALVSLTEKGKNMATATKTNGATETTSPYAIITGAVLPPSKRGFARGGGAPTVYPFNDLQVQQSFFVPVSEKHPDPVKTLGSTVSSANLRWSEKTGETKTVIRNKRGPKNKLLKDEKGEPIPEEVQVPIYRHTRKFSIRAVTKGQDCGGWKAEADGALIQRVM